MTAKLSKRFYDRFGEEIVNELVEWFNLVDATYRADLDGRSEAAAARTEARIDLRMAELRSEMDRRFADLRVEMNERFAKIEARLDGMATKEQLERGLREQTGLFFAAWGVLVVAVIGLWFR